jgi:asparagine N-glycosylation enzyme membrane subunit Stt3
MKKVFKLSLVLGVALLTMNVNASETDFSLSVKKEQGRIINFEFCESKKLKLSIYDKDDKIIYSENVDSQYSINRAYDLKNLPEGNYLLEAESEFKIATYQISVEGTMAILTEKPISEKFKPVFTEKEDLLKLSFLNLDKSPTFVKIYDQEYNLVYESGKLTDQNITMLFDIYNRKNENYTIVVIDNNITFTKTFDNK